MANSQGCPANAFGCDGCCVHQSLPKNWVVADRIDATRAQAGNEVKPNLRGLPSTDRFGRVAHVVGIRITGTMRWTAAAANDAVTNTSLFATFANFFLSDPYWDYLAGASDGRDLIEDRFLRSFVTNALENAGTAIAQNVGAGNVDRAIDLYWPLTRFDAKGHEGLVGSIPLALLKAKGDSAFRYTVRQAAPPIAGGAAAGLTAVGFQGNTTVWFELAYLDGAFVDQPWYLDNYTDNDLSNTARFPERTSEYFVVRPLIEDTAAGGGLYMTDFGIATHAIAGQSIMDGYSLAEQQQRTVLTERSWPLATDADPAMSSGGNPRMLFIVGPHPKTKAAQLPAGPISYRWTSRTRTFSRFLHRTIACHVPERIAKVGGRALAYGVHHDGSLVDPSGQKPVLIPVKQ